MGFVSQVVAWQGGGKSSYRAYSGLPTTQPGGRLGAKSEAEDLQDTAQYRLFVYPVVQGRGRRLFPDGYESSTLRLLEAKCFRSGITYSRYASA